MGQVIALGKERRSKNRRWVRLTLKPFPARTDGARVAKRGCEIRSDECMSGISCWPDAHVIEEVRTGLPMVGAVRRHSWSSRTVEVGADCGQEAGGDNIHDEHLRGSRDAGWYAIHMDRVTRSEPRAQ